MHVIKHTDADAEAEREARIEAAWKAHDDALNRAELLTAQLPDAARAVMAEFAAIAGTLHAQAAEAVQAIAAARDTAGALAGLGIKPEPVPDLFDAAVTELLKVAPAAAGVLREAARTVRHAGAGALG
jgi:hypothetical protein